jgi:hypothetical protein
MGKRLSMSSNDDAYTGISTAIAVRERNIADIELRLARSESHELRRELEFQEKEVSRLRQTLDSCKEAPACLAISQLPGEGATPIATLEAAMLSGKKGREIALYKLLSDYKRQYMRSGDPLAIASGIELNMELLADLLDYDSCQLSEIYSFLGHLLINAEVNMSSIKKAYGFLEKAISIIDRVDLFDRDVLEAKALASWLQSITVRMEGHVEKAHALCYSTYKDIDQLASFQIKLPLLREMAILERSSRGFQELYKKRALYEHDKVQAFHSFRRIFEHYLIKIDMTRADHIYPLLCQTFSSVRRELPKISVYSFLKNRYHYLRLKGETALAERLFVRVAKETRRLHLSGQYKDLVSIRRSLM